MQENENQNQQIILGRKKNIIDDDPQISKKAQKYKLKKQRKNQKQSPEIDNNQHPQQNLHRPILTKQEKHEIMVQDLKKIVECSESLIRQKLNEANYNKQLALNLIMNKLEQQIGDMTQLFDKKEQRARNVQTSNSRKRQGKNVAEEQAYKIFDEMYDKSDMQISGFQFEQLFNEITEIIKEDQKEKGRGLFEINNLMETCVTAKDAILVGLKDVFKMGAEVDFDQNDPVNIQLQNFIYEDTQKQVRQQIINKDEFPTMGEPNRKKQPQKNNTKSPSPPKRSIINQIQSETRQTSGPIKKQDLFKPSNNRPILLIEKNSIFNVDNQQQSEDALRQLHKEYNHVSINTLKIVYLTLEKNFNHCRTFLERYYPKEKKSIKKVEAYEISPRKQQPFHSNHNFLNTFRKQSISEIDKELQRWTLSQLRSEIQHLYGLRQVFHMTCNKISNSNQRKELIRIADERAPITLIANLSKASRVKLIEEVMRVDPHYVDLHGYRQEQITPILQGLIASLRENFDRGNEKIRYKTMGGKTEAILQVMTGKGRHSQYGRSVLKPCVRSWCSDHGLRAIVNEDNVEIIIPLM